MRTSLCLAGVLLTAFSATAQDRPQGRGPMAGRGGFMRFNPILSALDADHDGVISAAELANAPAVLKSLDKNGDGKITPDEVRPSFGPGSAGGPGGPGGPGGGMGPGGPPPGMEGDDAESAPRNPAQAFLRYDKNKDGKVARTEVPKRMQTMFDQADANHDGVLDADELAQLAQSRPGPRNAGPGGPGGPGGRRMDPIFAALDLDGDGVISADEIAKASESLKALDKNQDGKLVEEEVRPNFGPPRE